MSDTGGAVRVVSHTTRAAMIFSIAPSPEVVVVSLPYRSPARSRSTLAWFLTAAGLWIGTVAALFHH